MKFYYKYEPKSSDDRAYAEISILDSEGKTISTQNTELSSQADWKEERSREPVFSSAGGSGLSSLQLYIGSMAAAQIASDNILVLIRAVLYVVCVSILILSRRCIAASPYTFRR